MDTLPAFFRVPVEVIRQLTAPGMRKVTVMGGFLYMAFLSSLLMFAKGQIPYEQWLDFVLTLVQWGGGYFVGSNLAEHVIKAGASVGKPE